MEAIPRSQDLVSISFGCCMNNINPPLELLESSTLASPPRKPLSTRMSPRLRKSSVDIISSFTLGISDTINEVVDHKSTNENQVRRASVAECMSAADAARLVAQEYLAEVEQGQEEAIELKPSMHSLLDDDSSRGFSKRDHQEDKSEEGKAHRHSATATTCSFGSSSGNCSKMSQEDVLAMEVGISAHEYLEECFYTEVSVLNREKFDAIPEVQKSDFLIAGHLGKGSFSDVFEVVSKKGDIKKKPIAGTSAPGRRAPRSRRTTFSSSINTATLSLSRHSTAGDNGRVVLAMKCLRPQIRSDPEQFTIGAEDLVHETAILANLNHRHIIKVHARASGNLTDAFVLNDGYFILLDKLNETLSGRMELWKRNPKCINPMIVRQGPAEKQVEVAHCIADAVTYLHSKNIVFRDLKPANVGFDSSGVLKLFDFGFAVGLPEPDVLNPSGDLYERCGTPRYMAPEVGLSFGYGLPADVYSFGILLWEMCSLKKPFSYIKTSDEFDMKVFIGGARPEIESYWPSILKEIMSKCWTANPSSRPSMFEVKSTLSYALMSNGASKGSSERRPATIRTRRRSVVGW